jgi:hypothetical protein
MRLKTYYQQDCCSFTVLLWPGSTYRRRRHREALKNNYGNTDRHDRFFRNGIDNAYADYAFLPTLNGQASKLGTIIINNSYYSTVQSGKETA